MKIQKYNCHYYSKAVQQCKMNWHNKCSKKSRQHQIYCQNLIFSINFQQISYVEWSPPNAIANRHSVLATLNYSHRLQLFSRDVKSRNWAAVYDVTKLWHDYLKSGNWSLVCKITFSNVSSSKMLALVNNLSVLIIVQKAHLYKICQVVEYQKFIN